MASIHNSSTVLRAHQAAIPCSPKVCCVSYLSAFRDSADNFKSFWYLINVIFRGPRELAVLLIHSLQDVHEAIGDSGRVGEHGVRHVIHRCELEREPHPYEAACHLRHRVADRIALLPPSARFCVSCPLCLPSAWGCVCRPHSVITARCCKNSYASGCVVSWRTSDTISSSCSHHLASVSPSDPMH